MEKKFTRFELYELVWSEPMVALARRYLISDTGLRKLCRRMEIPIPNIGHWQNVQHGKTRKRKPLIVNLLVNQEVTLKLRVQGSGGVTGVESPLTILHHQILADKTLPLTVPDKLVSKDTLILNVKRDLAEKRYRTSGSLVSSSADYLDISVSHKNLKRALIFMSALIRILKLRGHSIEVKKSETFAIVEGQQIKLTLREKTKRVEGVETWQPGAYLPMGILSLQMKQSYHVMEAKDGKVLLENQLAKILAKLELKGREARLEAEHYKKLIEEREAKEKLEKERKHRQAKELEDFKTLIQKAERWKKAQLVREFINELKMTAKASDPWLEWAMGKCDWYDPLIESEDSTLVTIDRDSIFLKKEQLSFTNW